MWLTWFEYHSNFAILLECSIKYEYKYRGNFCDTDEIDNEANESFSVCTSKLNGKFEQGEENFLLELLGRENIFNKERFKLLLVYYNYITIIILLCI